MFFFFFLHCPIWYFEYWIQNWRLLGTTSYLTKNQNQNKGPPPTNRELANTAVFPPRTPKSHSQLCGSNWLDISSQLYHISCCLLPFSHLLRNSFFLHIPHSWLAQPHLLLCKIIQHNLWLEKISELNLLVWKIMNCHQVTCDKLKSTNIAQPTMVFSAWTKQWHNHSNRCQHIWIFQLLWVHILSLSHYRDILSILLMKLLVTPKSSNTGVFEKYFLSKRGQDCHLWRNCLFSQKKIDTVGILNMIDPRKQNKKWCLKFGLKQVSCSGEKN